jgi:hypothetical protein
MQLSSDKSNLNEALFVSFKLQINESGEILNNLNKTLKIFCKDYQEMVSALNTKAAHLRNGFSPGEKEQINSFNGIINEILASIISTERELIEIQTCTFNLIKEFKTDKTQGEGLDEFIGGCKVGRIQNENTSMPGGLMQYRAETSKECINILDEIDRLRQPYGVPRPKDSAKNDTGSEQVKIDLENDSIASKQVPRKPMTLGAKILDYISKHPKGVRISEMEDILGEPRMKLGFITKNLLDEGKVLKVENIYYPKPKL